MSEWEVESVEGDWEVATVEPIVRRTVGERFGGNFIENLSRSPIAQVLRGEAAATAGLGSGAPRFNPLGGPGIPLTSPALDAAMKAPPPATGGTTEVIMTPEKERARREAIAAQGRADPWHAAPGGLQAKTVAGASTLVGSLLGGAMDPLNWIGGGSTVLRRALSTAGIGAGLDVVGQTADIGSKTQDKWEPVQTISAAALGAGLSGAQDLARMAPKWITAEAERAQAAKRAKADAETAEAVARPWTVQDLWGALEVQEGAKGRMDVRSPKGAKGPGQLMPGTAQWVADQLGRPDLAAKALSDDPNDAWANRYLGQTYLGMQMREFGDDPVLALAAYNAGPGAVKKWIDRFGLPSDVGRAKWIEMIPFAETRGYVRNILKNAAGGEVRLAPEEVAVREQVAAEATPEGPTFAERQNVASQEAAAAVDAAQGEVAQAQAAQTAAVDTARQQMTDRSAEIERELTQEQPGAPPSPDTAQFADEFDRLSGKAPEPDAPPRDLTDDALDILRSGKKIKVGEGPSLAEALLDAGGLREFDGELRNILGGAGDNKFWKMLRRVNTGLTLDDAALWAWERGYLGKAMDTQDGTVSGSERPSINDLLEALDEEARGNKRYASENAERLEMRERVQALEEMIDYLGLDRNASNAELRAAMDDFMEDARAREDGSLLDADEAERLRRENPDDPRLNDEINSGAAIYGVKGRDQADMFDADASQRAGQLAADLDRLIREKQAKRGREPMAEGSLFDEVRRGEQDLFGLGAKRAKAVAAGNRLRELNAALGKTLPGQQRPVARPFRPDEAHPTLRPVREIAQRLLRELRLVRRQGRLGIKGALGTYSRKTGEIRTKGYDELDALAHEIGHAIDMSHKHPSLTRMMGAHSAVLKAMDYEPGRADRAEGFAEWFRFYITNPEFARRLAPGVYADFEAGMHADAPRDFRAIRQAQKDYKERLDASSMEVAQTYVTNPPKDGFFAKMRRELDVSTPTTIMQNMADEIYRGVIRDTHQWAVVVRELGKLYKKNTGRHMDLEIHDDPSKLIQMFPMVAAQGHDANLYGPRLYHSLERGGPGLAEALQVALGDDWKSWPEGDRSRPEENSLISFGTYLVGRRAIHLYDRWAAGKMKNPPDDASKAMWEQTVADLELHHPQYEMAADMVYQFNRALIQLTHDAGFIDTKTLDYVLTEHPDYVPLNRDVSHREQVGGARGSATKDAGGLVGIHGSDLTYMNPIHSMMQRSYELHAMIQRNDAVLALADLAEATGQGSADWVVRLPSSEIRGQKVDAIEAVERAADEIGVSDVDKAMVLTSLQNLFGAEALTTIYRAQPMQPKSWENVVWGWREGKPVVLQLPDGKFGRGMIDVLSGMGAPARGAWIQVAAAPARFQRGMITSYPAYGLMNFLRDQPTAWAFSDVGFVPFYDALRGAASEWSRGDLAKLYAGMGGQIGGVNAEQAVRGDRTRDVQVLRPGETIRHFANIHGLARAVETVETGTRMGIFDRGMKQGVRDGLSAYEAAIRGKWAAWDYMNFLGTGAWGAVRDLGAVVPFFRAALNVVDKFARVSGGIRHAPGALKAIFDPSAAISPKAQRELKHGMKLWGLAATIGTMMWAYRVHMNESDQAEEYAEVSKKITDRHIPIFIPGGSGLYFAAPKPPDIAFMSNVVEGWFNSAVRKEPDAGANVAKALWESFSPPTETPLITNPLDLAANRDVYGSPIVPDYLTDAPKQDQKSDRTSGAAVAITDTLRDLTRNEKTGQSAIDLSAAQVDYLMKQPLANWGRDLLKPDRKPAPMGWSPIDTPILSRFIKGWWRGSASTAKFYDLVAAREGQWVRDKNGISLLMRDQKYMEAGERLAKMPATERGFMMSAIFQRGDDKLEHPLIRGYEVVKEYSRMANDLQKGNLRLDGEVIELSPTERRWAVESLKKMTVAEQQNALIMTGVSGWKEGREPLPAYKYGRELAKADPRLVTLLASRLAEAGIGAPETDYAKWAEVREEREAARAPAEIAVLLLQKDAKSKGVKKLIDAAMEKPVPVK